MPAVMTNASPTRFECPNCGARYMVVRVEANSVSADREITCAECGGPLHGREGGFFLKYFLVERPQLRRRRAR